MGRRNVLGNQIEESNTMWVVLLGLLVSAVQFAIYYFVGGDWLGLMLAGRAVLIGGVIIHFVMGELEELFSFFMIPCILSGAMGLMIPHMATEILPESGTALLGCVFAWLIPVLYACIFTWAEGHTAMRQFCVFYKKAIIFFDIIYFGFLIYWFVFRLHVAAGEADVRLIPFATFAAYVDGMINDTVSVQRLMGFLTERVVLFLPYGFFIAMVGRKLHSLVRLALVFVLPLLIELFQFLFRWGVCDADDAVFSFLGGMVGMVCFVIFNALFQKTTGKHFDGSEVERDYYGRRICHAALQTFCGIERSGLGAEKRNSF